MAFEEGKCAGISIWILLGIDIAEVVVSLPYHIWQFDVVCWRSWLYGRCQRMLLHHSLFGLVLLCYKTQKVNSTLQFIRSRYNSAFMQWLCSEDKLSTNNPIILKSLSIINMPYYTIRTLLIMKSWTARTMKYQNVRVVTYRDDCAHIGFTTYVLSRNMIMRRHLIKKRSERIYTNYYNGIYFTKFIWLQYAFIF